MLPSIEQGITPSEGPATDGIAYDVPPADATDEVARSYVGGLPPEEFRLRDVDDKIPTPLDQYGVVDPDKLIREVMKTVSPEYRWPGRSDIHHGQWCRSQYARMQVEQPASMALTFRELAPNKIQVPRVFHNWIHVITIPPPMPDPEIMRESVREWTILQDFFRSVQDAAQVERLYGRDRARRAAIDKPYTESQERIVLDEQRRRMEGIYTHFSALQTVPIERWPFSPHAKLQVAAGRIGGLVLTGYHKRSWQVRRPDLVHDMTGLAA